MNLVPDRVRAEMAALEAIDAADRADGTPQARRLRAIRPEVGQLLLTLALAIAARTIVEVGTSGGYSTLWLAVAAGRTGGRVVTFEIDPDKARRARRTFAAAGVEALVDLRESEGGRGLAALAGSGSGDGTGRDLPAPGNGPADPVLGLEAALAAPGRGAADLIFLDAEKADYLRFLEPAVEALRPGGLLVADNLTTHAAALSVFREAALADPRLSGVVVPIGGGELVAVRLAG